MKNMDHSEYIQAAVETIELIALLFNKLSEKQEIEDFCPVLQTIIEAINNRFKEGRLSSKYWEATNNISNWAIGIWKKTPEIAVFYEEIRKKREYFLMHISSNTNFLLPRETFEKIFDEYAAIDPLSGNEKNIIYYFDDEKPESPKSGLQKILEILRSED